MASITVSSVLALHAEIITLHETLATARAKRDRLARRKASLTAEIAKMKREKEEVEVALLLFAGTPIADTLVHETANGTVSAVRKRKNPFEGGFVGSSSVSAFLTYKYSGPFDTQPVKEEKGRFGGNALELYYFC
ncbi:hypothetical protein B0H11DRAFT_2357764 [Mycena galericulata]|nr:hypothetical protein B0H11DRAFT_2357764 [Mycena galericulata]